MKSLAIQSVFKLQNNATQIQDWKNIIWIVKENLMIYFVDWVNKDFNFSSSFNLPGGKSFAVQVGIVLYINMHFLQAM